MTAKVCRLWLVGLVGALAVCAPRVEAADREPVSSNALMRAEVQLDSCVAKIEKTVLRQGPAMVAHRMARELGMAPAALMIEHALLDCFLGDLLIAHWIRANAQTDMTAAQLLAQHAGGVTWSEIAVGLGLKLNRVVRGLINETRVSAGLSRGDGRIAAMRTADPRAALASAEAAAGTAEPRVGSPGARARLSNEQR